MPSWENGCRNFFNIFLGQAAAYIRFGPTASGIIASWFIGGVAPTRFAIADLNGGYSLTEGVIQKARVEFASLFRYMLGGFWRRFCGSKRD
jgi:hypothetical protein